MKFLVISFCYQSKIKSELELFLLRLSFFLFCILNLKLTTKH
jgi:hypothetical protein